MNNLISLKGGLKEKKNLSTPGASKFLTNESLDIGHLKKIGDDLKKCYDFWKDERNTIINGALVSVFYKRIVPKSKRIKTLLSYGSEHSNSSIRGARFNPTGDKHIITHFVNLDTIYKSIENVNIAILILDEYFDGNIDNNDLEKIDNYKDKIEKLGLSKSKFINIVTDASSVEKIDILFNSKDVSNDNIISLYDISMDYDLFFSKIGIAKESYTLFDSNSIVFKANAIKDFNKFKENFSYMISMAVTDISEISTGQYSEKAYSNIMSIPEPGNEPTIGVIDTLFDETVYFKDWVKYEDLLGELPRDEIDYKHGTSVSSIIVDGPSMNPVFDDGCGRFKVRHFGVAKHGKNSSISIMRNIAKIIEENSDIHVWNLSLGSELEINDNFISPIASLLDRLQFEKNIIFVVAGTNKSNKESVKIGSPADSINSLVVNAVDFKGQIPSYARKGKVLSFFNKPDICYYGGDISQGFSTCTKNGEHIGVGTSYAAPWIARKLCYLIDIIGLTRETAKALIIDSATNWNIIDEKEAEYKGFGIVPIRIEDIINSKDDEIKFYIEGVSNLYDTYTHNIPVPLYKEKYPFIAKATMCYFPECSRNQGVDYTNKELDIYFGRITNKGVIKSINENKQSEGNEIGIEEKDARKNYRKWDNVKHITQILKKNLKPKQQYDNPMWGLSIKAKDRLDMQEKKGVKFGIVITLKEINGINRIDDFINHCSLRGWLVRKIDVENQIDIYNTAYEEIKFD